MDSALKSDAYASMLRAGGRLLVRHPWPLLARGCVQLLIRLPGREVEVVDGSGHSQRVHTRDQMGANLLVGRYRLPPDVMARISPGDWVIDCGANIGITTSQLASAVGRDGRVWAMEPLPDNIERLRFLCDRNGLSQLVIFPLAVGAQEGAVSIGMPPAERSGWGSITKSWNISHRQEVPVDRLDHLVEAADEAQRRVRFLKIDVEGYEFEVVEGAAAVLSDHRPAVYCEFNDILLRDRGRSSAELLALFADLGYQPVDGQSASNLRNRVENLLLQPSTPEGFTRRAA